MKKILTKYLICFSIFLFLMMLIGLWYKTTFFVPISTNVSKFNELKTYETKLEWEEASSDEKKALYDALLLLLKFTSYIEQNSLENLYNDLAYTSLSFNAYSKFINTTFNIGKLYTPSISYYIKEQDRLLMSVIFTEDEGSEVDIGEIASLPAEPLELILEILDNKIAIQGKGFELDSIPDKTFSTINNFETNNEMQYTESIPNTTLDNVELLFSVFTQQQALYINEQVAHLISVELPNMIHKSKNDENYYVNNKDWLLNYFAVEDINKFTNLCSYNYLPEDIKSISILPNSINDFFGNIMGFKVLINLNSSTSYQIGIQVLKSDPLTVRLSAID